MTGETLAGLHGAAVHFPIALVLGSLALDAAAFMAPGSVRAGLHAAGHWMIVLAAAGTLPAVASGLFLTHGTLLGHGDLRRHHLFVWPAFALIVAAATWRLQGREPASARPAAGYLASVGLAAGLVMAAGYTGGKLLLRG